MIFCDPLRQARYAAQKLLNALQDRSVAAGQRAKVSNRLE